MDKCGMGAFLRNGRFLLAVSFFIFGLPAVAQLPPPQEEAYCWVVADGGDRLIFLNKDGDGIDNRGAMGVPDVESIAFNPASGILYTSDNDQWGYLDYNDAFDGDMDDSEFVAIGTGLGMVTLPDGSTETINDVDGLQFDLTRTDASTGTFVLWATDRESGSSDLLFQIDPTTGLVDTTPTPGFANGATAVRITGAGALIDVDDIAVDPITGIIYAINNDSGSDDQFGIVDPVTGQLTFVATFRDSGTNNLVNDMEGFSFSVTGELYGTTGDGSAFPNIMWLIDKETGVSTQVASLGAVGTDYEGCSCLTDNVISGTVYFDLDGDNAFEPGDGEKGFSNATVHVHIDTNNDGDVDAGEPRLCESAPYNLSCPVTDADGTYRFPVGQGNFAITVDVSTVPAGSTLTHPTNNEEADFGTTTFGAEDPNNDFGFTLPAGTGSLDLDKTSNGGASVVQGDTITYTLTVTNNSGVQKSEIDITDSLPLGVTYVPSTTSVTGPAEWFVRDNFDAVSFDGSNGTRLWAGDWTESNEEAGGSGAAVGQIQVTDQGLRLDDEPDSAGDPAVERVVDTSAFTNPILSFDWLTSAGVDSSDTIRVEASTGGAYTVLEDITDISGTDTGSRVYDLTSFISATTTVRFTVFGSYNSTNEFFYIDNLEIRDGANWRDNWESNSFSNQDGNQNWTTDWLEVGEADGPAAGDLRQLSFGGRNAIRVRDSNRSLTREANLSGYESARLSFFYRRDQLDNSNDFVSVQISGNGGGNWTELVRLRGPDDDTFYRFLSFDVSDFIGTNTRVRFESSGTLGTGDQIYFDDVMLDVRGINTLTQDNLAGGANDDLIDGTPPQLVAAADRFVLANGANLTVTFDVTVDNPISPGLTTLTNTGLVTSGDDPPPIIPTTDTHTDNVISGSLGDLVWQDDDGDGVLDAGESGIPGITVELDDGVCTVGVDCLTAVTDGSGNYLFDNLAPGTYRVHVDDTTLPAGMVLSASGSDPSADFVVVTDEAHTTADFPYFVAATVSGHLYLDDNVNGTQDGGDPDLADIDIEITDALGGTQTVTTDASGDWTATVVPGSTTANVDEGDADFPIGYTQSEGADPSVVTAVAGADTDAGIDGYAPTGIVFGHVYEDLDNNGNQDGADPDLPNIDVVITDALGNDHTVATDGSGDWDLEVVAGSTTINVDETDPDFPAGATQTEGTDPNVVNVAAGDGTNGGIDGYHVPAGTGTVSGHLYIDTNGDGNQDAGEPDLADVDVVVTDSTMADQTVTTDANGDWSATVPAGNTTADIDETDPDYPTGYSQTEGTDPTSVTAVAGNNVDAGNDGFYLAGTVSGHLYIDTNGNSTQDGGEPNLPNVDVVVTDSNGSPQTVASDANGDWTATVPPGSTSANVDETDGDFPSGYTQSEGTDPTIVTAVAGSDVNAGNDGYYQSGTVSGHLYIDTNGNSTQDGGEPNLPNVDVVVTDSNGSPQTVTSDANGDWTATVPPGSTSANVDETDGDFPSGYTQSEGTDPTVVTAVAGSDVDAGNDGYYQSGTVSGHLYIDTNGNSTQDGGEPNLPNVDVVVTDSNGSPQTVTSDANGDWTATVPPGSTSADVDETDGDFPTGYTQSEGTDPTVVTAVAGSDVDAGNDGYYQSGTVSGHLYIDTNGNSTQDGGEPNLPNVDVVVTDSNGSPQTVSSDANGDWTATVPPGSTSADVDETDGDFPSGYTQSEGTDPTVVTAVAGSDVDAGNDGYYQSGTVSGHLYIDTNGNSTQDGGEPNLSNVDVVVTDSNGSPQTVSSDANGDWTATVPPGSTSADVDETDGDFPSGYTQSEGTDPTVVTAVAGSDVDAGSDGYYQSGTVSGHLYIDTNGNSAQDGGEPNLPNVDVVVTDSNGSPQTVSSDANGDWSATVPPGSTSADVDETDGDFPTGYTQSEGTDPTVVTAVAGSDVDAGNDGYYQSGTVSGHLYIDTNGNSTQDGGEPNLPNVEMVVTDSNGSPQTISSDANGDWSATVPPGSTSADVDETDGDFPTGYTQSEGTDPTVVTAVAGSDVDAGNDGYYQSGTVSGHLYIDTNGNNTQDGGEPNLPNVDVVVTDSNGAPQTVSSDANGDWTATVPPGSTSADVDETDGDFPTGYTQSEGTDPTVVTAVAGSDVDAGNDGYYQSGTVSGHLYLDTNGDGSQDAGEPNLADVDVIVTDSNGTPQTVASDANGDWQATVPPGSTSADVDETDAEYPTGYTQTEGTDPTVVTAIAGTDVDAGNDGYYQTGTVFGHLYIDTNGNSTQDAGEPDLANVDVLVTDANGATQTVTSDASGDWTATVPPGSTTADVDETDAEYPSDHNQTEGTDPSVVTAIAGTDVDAGNDGYYLGGTVFGHLYLDTNGNGIQEAGEPDLPNVDVIITDALSATTTVSSDASGNWAAGVAPGLTSADVDETDPEYPSDTLQTEGDDPTTVTTIAGESVDAGNDGYFLPIPEIGLAKVLVDTVNYGDGTYGVTFQLLVANTGNRDLSSINVTDDMDATFTAPATYSIDAVTSPTLTVNPGYTGSAPDTGLLAGTDVLPIGASGTIEIVLTVTPGANLGTYFNTATATGVSPETVTVNDDSQDGTDPDPEDNGPGDNSDPTPVIFDEHPVLGLAKTVIDQQLLSDGTTLVRYLITVANLGDILLSNLQVTDDLSITFPAPATYTVTDLYSPDFAVNLAYTGNGAGIDMLLGSDQLAIGESGTLELEVNLIPSPTYLGPFYNQAMGYAESPAGSTVSDPSQDGVEPDPNGNGPEDDNEPTPVSVSAVVPTLGTYGLMALMLLLMFAAMKINRRQRSI